MRVDRKDTSTLQDKLRGVFARAKLPTNPSIAAQVLALVNDPRSTSEQFAEVIAGDPALAARLMKMSNSSFFAQSHEVSTIQRAVTVLGLRRIRMAAVGFQLVSHLDRLGASAFDLPRFWQHSVLRACLAREVATLVAPALAEEAFLVGLLQDCGILLLVQIYGDEYAALCDEQWTDPGGFIVKERERFEFDHVDVIAALAEDWQLAEVLAKPLEQHHQCPRAMKAPTDIDRLCAVSAFIGALPLAEGNDTRAGESLPLDAARVQLGLDETQLESCVYKAGEAYAQVAELFEAVLPQGVDVTDLLAEANHQLSLAADSGQDQADRLKNERSMILEERTNLRHAVAQYREQAARDPLTGLLNRGALVDATIAAQQGVHQRGEALAVFFIDLDDFKILNDDLGHIVGDQVLRLVAQIARNAVTNAGCAGRYGGEEFVVVIPGLSATDAEQWAADFVQIIREADWSMTARHAPVTCSLGAVWGAASLTPDQWFQQADQRMYEAKRAGKDRYIFETLGMSAGSMSPAPDPGFESAELAGATESTEDSPALIARLHSIAAQLPGEETNTFTGDRKQKRQSLQAPCRVGRLTGADLAVVTVDGYLLDYSMGGLGLLVAGRLIRGDLVEISVARPTGSLYVAGFVAFCRHVCQDVHQVGVQIVNHDQRPIFAHDPVHALQKLTWLHNVVDNLFGESGDIRKSA